MSGEAGSAEIARQLLRWQLRWWRPGGFRCPSLARATNGRHGMGRWTADEVASIKERAAIRAAEIGALVAETPTIPPAPSDAGGRDDRDDRDPTPCPKCGEACTYDGWGLVHTNGLGIGSCANPPSPDVTP